MDSELPLLIANTADMERNLFIQQIVSSIEFLVEELRPQPDSLLIKFAIPFAASLLGALGAFALNWVKEVRKENYDHNSRINEATILFSENKIMVLNFKKQFLEKFTDELKTIGLHAANYGHKISEAESKRLATEWEKDFRPRIAQIFYEYQDHPVYASFNGLLKRGWENPSFTTLDVKQISFVANKMPEIIRFVINAASRLDLFKETLKQRSDIWEKAEPVFAGDHLWEPRFEFMCHLFEMINIRETLSEYADQVLVLLHSSEICLQLYQEQRFPKPKFFKILQRYPRVTCKLTPEALASMPMPSVKNGIEFIGGFPKSLFGPRFEEIKSRWTK